MRPFHRESVPPPPGIVPFDWSQARDYRALEIGCGNGMHALRWALQNPKKTMIAIEQTKNKFESFQKRMSKYSKSELQNLHALRADAIWWCAHNLEGPQLDEIFILYPNPNPKPGQANKRFHNMPFMGFLLEHLKPGGQLTLASNVKTYIEEAKQQYVSHWELQLEDQSELHSESFPRTAFEKKYLERGELCFNLVFRK